MKLASIRYRQGWAVWLLALLVAITLPGKVWHGGPMPGFPVDALVPAACLMISLTLAAPILAWRLGPTGATGGLLAMLEAPPDFLWGGLVLGIWPAAWGPPGLSAWSLAFLAAALPTEVRWLCGALPVETPFPAAYGIAAIRTARKSAVVHLLPQWTAARLPLWLTAALVLERIFGVQGLGNDWMNRIATRDRLGLAAWILTFALLWRISRAWEKP